MREMIKGWKFVKDDERECFKLVRIDAIETEDGKENAWVADIYEMGDFLEFVQEEIDYKSPPPKSNQENKL